jgi:hypothetical protein
VDHTHSFITHKYSLLGIWFEVSPSSTNDGSCEQDLSFLLMFDFEGMRDNLFIANFEGARYRM